MRRLFVLGLGLLFAGFALLLVIGGIANLHHPRPAAASSSIPAASAVSLPAVESRLSFPDQVLRHVGIRSPKWAGIHFDPDNSKNQIALTIVYRRTPSGYGEVQSDTERMARAVLQTLMANGRNPHAEWISVSVRAQQPAGQGETGADLIHVFGSTRYDFNSDQLIFEIAQ